MGLQTIHKIRDSILSLRLASVQHASQSGLLRRCDCQRPLVLNLDPTARISAVKRRERGLPNIRALVALVLVDVVRDGPELRRRDVVGELLAL